MNYHEECLVGWHKYIKNGVVVESTIQYAGLPYFGGHSSIFAWNETPEKIYGIFRDQTKSKRCDLYLTMLDSNYTQMQWQLYYPRGIQPSNFVRGFTLPEYIILTKQ